MTSDAAPPLSRPTPLSSEHEIAQFDCGQPELNGWLHAWSRRAAEADTARTFVVCRENRVVGYFTLSAGAVAHHPTSGGKAPRVLRQNAPDPVPVIVLGRLAVDLSEQGRGIGSALVAEAMRRMAQASTIVGARALLVHALDDRLAEMYVTLGFKRFSEGSRTLYLSTRAIRDAL